MNTRPDGFLLVDKPSDITSFNALSAVKRRFGTKKVGHAGTLDKFAEGLLVTLIGKMTKASGYVMGLPKEYRARILLGVETDTLDPEGRIVDEAEHIPRRSEFEAALEGFLGPIEQVPPRFSALHVNGVRAHRLAREGKEIPLQARRVVIHELELVDYTPPHADIRVVCSKGTYVRSLARDIALALGTRGHLISLRRTRIGPFLIDEAVRPGEIDSGRILPPIDFFSRIEDIATPRVEEGVRLKVSRGQTLEDRFFRDPGPTEGLNAVFDSDDNFLALIEKKGTVYTYKFVGARG